MKRTYALFVVLCIPLCLSQASAQLINCDGVWTNQTCEGTSKQTLKEQPYVPRTPEEEAQSKRELIVHDMQMLAIEARDVLNIPVSVSSVEAVCTRSDDDVSSCATAAANRKGEIESLLAAHKRVEREKEKEEKIDTRSTTVSIIHNNYPDYFVRRRRLPACCSSRCRHSEKCKPFAQIERDNGFFGINGVRTPGRADGNFRNNRNASSSRSSSQGSVWGNPYQSPFR